MDLRENDENAFKIIKFANESTEIHHHVGRKSVLLPCRPYCSETGKTSCARAVQQPQQPTTGTAFDLPARECRI